MSRPSVIVPVFDVGPTPERCVEAIRRGAPGVDVRTAPADPAALNAAAAASGGDVLLFVPSFVRPAPELVPGFLAALDRNRAAGVACGDYEITVDTGEVVRQCVLAREGDLSEWSSTGYATAIRRETFESVGGYDPGYGVAAEYDLRLRITREWGLARSPGPLYGIAIGEVPFDEPAVKAKLRRYFTPETSPRGGFGSLHGAADEMQEIERAFEAELCARGARLEGPTEPLRCPHGEASPRVSVVIPVHDRAELMVLAIESVTAGAYRDFEILAVDGGSTDGTVEAVAAIAAERPEVRLVHAPENRIASSMNAGVRAARGRYVARLDSDDLYTPDTLERMVRHLDSRPDEALAVSYYDFIDAEGEPMPGMGTVEHAEYDRNTILRTNGVGAARVWHRCALERLGGFDEENCGDYAEDYDMVLRVSERWAVGRVHEVLYHCRLHGGNTHRRLGMETRARAKSGARRRALRRRAGGSDAGSPGAGPGSALRPSRRR